MENRLRRVISKVYAPKAYMEDLGGRKKETAFKCLVEIQKTSSEIVLCQTLS